jgi:hypothetical protein
MRSLTLFSRESDTEMDLNQPADELSPPQRPQMKEIEDVEELSDRSAFESEKPPEPETPVLRGPPPLDISRPVVKLRSDQSIGRSEYARTTGAPRPLRINLADGKLLRLAAAAIFILLVIGFVPGLVKEGRSEKLGDLVLRPDAVRRRRRRQRSRRAPLAERPAAYRRGGCVSTLITRAQLLYATRLRQR